MLLNDYAYVLGFLIIGVGFVVVNTILPRFITPTSRGLRATDPYESGEVPIGTAWIQFDLNYYLFALIFLVFDVEAVFLFPILLIYKQVADLTALTLITMFLALLSFAILYAWKKGVFAWK